MFLIKSLCGICVAINGICNQQHTAQQFPFFHSVRAASDFQESPGQITERNQIVDNRKTV